MPENIRAEAVNLARAAFWITVAFGVLRYAGAL